MLRVIADIKTYLHANQLAPGSRLNHTRKALFSRTYAKSGLQSDRELQTKLRRLVYSESDLDELGILSRMTRYRRRMAGQFPQTRKVGGRALYDAAEIHAWWKRQGTNGGQGTTE